MNGADQPCMLREPARLYVRPAGSPSLARPRRFLVDYPAGSLFLPLAADGVVFDLVASRSGDHPPAVAPVLLDATALDDWVERLSTMTCFSHPGAARSIGHGQTFRAVAGDVMCGTRSLWIRAASPVLSLGQDVGAACLPIPEDLGVVCLERAEMRSLSTAELLQEAGEGPVLDAAERTAAVIARWLVNEHATQADRASEAGRRDNGQREATSRLITDIASAGVSAATPPASALAMVADRSGIALRSSRPRRSGERFDQWLARCALASGFRYRGVALQSRWWMAEGGPLLLAHQTDQEPRAALWESGRYHLFNPEGTASQPITAALAETVGSIGYILYPSLPARVGIKGLARFALRGAGGEAWRLVLTGLLVTLIGFIMPVVTGEIVSTAIPDGRASLILHMALIAAAAALGAAAASLARGLSSIRASSLIEIKLQAAVWDRILSLPTRFFRDYSTGDLTQRVLAIDAIRRILTGPVLNGLMSGLFALMSFGLMLFYDTRLAGFGVAFAVVNALILFMFARRQMRHLTAARDATGKVSGEVIDILSGILKLRIAAAEERAFARWGETFAGQQYASRGSGVLASVQSVVMTMLSSCGIAGIFLVTTLRPTPLELAAFAAFSAAFGQFSSSLTSFAGCFGIALEVVPLFKSVRPILNAVPEHEAGYSDPGCLTGRIDVRGVSFRYDVDGPMILDGIDFSIEPGQFVAIVGPSGSGKSTLLRLLLGFEAVTQGAIFYDNRDLAKIDLRLLRRQIGTVLQSTGLFPGSLYENIAGSKPLSDEQVLSAAARAGLAQDIAAFPMGLETIVSEDGGTLSGGQRQRVMIARALVGQPAFLFFDEATSALDNRTQAIVSEGMERLSVTRVVIAHRLSTVRHADKILVIDKGRLVEQGRYEELMNRQGLFYRLASRQIV